MWVTIVVEFKFSINLSFEYNAANNVYEMAAI